MKGSEDVAVWPGASSPDALKQPPATVYEGGPRTRFRPRFTGTHRGNGGEPVAIGIDVDRLYFFDLKTGNAIS